MSFSSERRIAVARGEIFELTGLRGVAALMVALLHFNFDVAGRFGQIYENLTRMGFLGVDLFFILSGFVIAYKYHDIRRFWSRDYVRFMWFRFWQIYPTHFFITIFYVPIVVTSLLLSYHVDPERFSLSSLIANLLMVQSWLGSDTMTWNVPAWSVSAEWLAYVLFPVLITLSAKVPRSLVIVACTALLLVVPAIFATVNISGAGFTGLVRLFPEFLSGCLIWRIYSHDMSRARIFDLALTIVLVLMLTSGLYLPTEYPFLVLPLFACAIYLSCRSIGIASRILQPSDGLFGDHILFALSGSLVGTHHVPQRPACEYAIAAQAGDHAVGHHPVRGAYLSLHRGALPEIWQGVVGRSFVAARRGRTSWISANYLTREFLILRPSPTKPDRALQSRRAANIAFRIHLLIPFPRRSRSANSNRILAGRYERESLLFKTGGAEAPLLGGHAFSLEDHDLCIELAKIKLRQDVGVIALCIDHDDVRIGDECAFE